MCPKVSLALESPKAAPVSRQEGRAVLEEAWSGDIPEGVAVALLGIELCSGFGEFGVEGIDPMPLSG
jgi:hypothetical protein